MRTHACARTYLLMPTVRALFRRVLAFGYQQNLLHADMHVQMRRCTCIRTHRFVLAFGCQQNLLPIINELHRPTPARTLTVSLWVIGFTLQP